MRLTHPVVESFWSGAQDAFPHLHTLICASNKDCSYEWNHTRLDTPTARSRCSTWPGLMMMVVMMWDGEENPSSFTEIAHEWQVPTRRWIDLPRWCFHKRYDLYCIFYAITNNVAIFPFGVFVPISVSFKIRCTNRQTGADNISEISSFATWWQHCPAVFRRWWRFYVHLLSDPPHSTPI